MFQKFFGVFYTLICFFGSMLLAFGAEFLVEDKYVFLGLIFLSFFILIFGIIFCMRRITKLFPLYWEIIATEIVLILLIVPTGLWEKFIMFRDQFDYYWYQGWIKGIQWVLYPIGPALALFLLAIITGIMDFFYRTSRKRHFVGEDESKE